MVLDASSQLELTEEESKLFNLLARYSEHNVEVRLPLDYLKEEIHRGGIDLGKLEVLLEKMQDVGVVSEYEPGGEHPSVCISSKQVEAVKTRLQQGTCPECRKQTLIERTVLYCPNCKHQYDKNQTLQTPHASLTASFRMALRRIFRL